MKNALGKYCSENDLPEIKNMGDFSRYYSNVLSLFSGLDIFNPKTVLFDGIIFLRSPFFDSEDEQEFEKNRIHCVEKFKNSSSNWGDIHSYNWFDFHDVISFEYREKRNYEDLFEFFTQELQKIWTVLLEAKYGKDVLAVKIYVSEETGNWYGIGFEQYRIIE